MVACEQSVNIPITDVAACLFAAVRKFCVSIGMTESELADAQIKSSLRTHGAKARELSTGVEPVLMELSELLNRWHSSSAFVDGCGQPLGLPVQGEVSLESLANAIGANNPTLLVRTAVSLGMFFQTAPGLFAPQSRSAILRGQSQLAYAYSAIVVGRLLDALSHNVGVSRSNAEPWFERTVDQARVRTRDIPLFERFVADQGQYFIDTIDDWLASHRAESNEQETTYVGVSTFAWSRQHENGNA